MNVKILSVNRKPSVLFLRQEPSANMLSYTPLWSLVSVIIMILSMYLYINWSFAYFNFRLVISAENFVQLLYSYDGFTGHCCNWGY